MTQQNAIQLFEGKQVRIAWNEEEEKYYFSIADIVQILTDSKDIKQYIKRMQSRDPELNSRWGTICTPTEMTAADGKNYKTQAADLEGIFRIIQSILLNGFVAMDNCLVSWTNISHRNLTGGRSHTLNRLWAVGRCCSIY